MYNLICTFVNIRFFPFLFLLFISCSSNSSMKEKISKSPISNPDVKQIALDISNSKYNKDSIYLVDEIADLSAANFDSLISSISVLDTIFPNLNSLMRQIAIAKGSSEPQKVLSLLNKYPQHWDNHYQVYEDVMLHWIATSPKEVEAYLFQDVMKWAGASSVYGKELLAIYVKQKLEQNFDSTLVWCDAIPGLFEKYRVYESIFNLVFVDNRLTQLANHLSPQATVVEFRMLFAKIGEELVRKGADEAIAWGMQLPAGSTRHLTLCKIFESIAYFSPNDGVRWFNQPDSYKKIHMLNSKGSKLNSKLLCSDIVYSFVNGLLSNEKTTLHPSEQIVRIKNSQFRPLFMTEYNVQIRRLDPENTEHPISIDF